AGTGRPPRRHRRPAKGRTERWQNAAPKQRAAMTKRVRTVLLASGSDVATAVSPDVREVLVRSSYPHPPPRTRAALTRRHAGRRGVHPDRTAWSGAKSRALAAAGA